jgi:protein disulfide-isomerase-like protein
MKFSIAAFLAFFAVANALELTADNWEAETAGKTVFLKFFAPWCGHCKKMKPDWDKLMEAFAGSATQLVADVDCTTGGKPLCDANGVKGYPTLKWGDPSALVDYQGGRDYDSFKTFAEENLKPMCSPANIDICDDEKKAEIKKFQDMPVADLDALIKEKDEEQAKYEGDFTTFVEGLQKQYQDASEAKDAALEAVKSSGLGLMKAVKANIATPTKDEL